MVAMIKSVKGDPLMRIAFLAAALLVLTAQPSLGNASDLTSVPVSRTTVFHVASITKEFTSVAVMMLVESGRLKLDEPIGHDLDDLPVNWRGITVRQLLNHTSGLPDIINKASEPLAATAGEALRTLRDNPWTSPLEASGPTIKPTICCSPS